ncbi:MAG: PDZ domain-containing protein [bacterium]|nr:PDZ domain-containing protein [bacterium]
MNLRPQTMREWVVLVGGGTLAVGLLLWFFLVVPGQELLHKNREINARYRKRLDEVRARVQRSNELQSRNRELSALYTNFMNKIGDLLMPDNLGDRLLLEFEKIDRLFGSNVRQAEVRPITTNRLHRILMYRLNDVQCSWNSLHPVLQLIESSGQLVGFESLRLNVADESDKRNVKIKLFTDIKSYIFPEQGKRPWRPPDYQLAEVHGTRDIFSWPEQLIPATSTPGSIAPDPSVPPPWANLLQLTGIATFQGSPYAIIRQRTDRKEFRYPVGATLSNAPNVKVLRINTTNEIVTLFDGLREYDMELRKERKLLFSTNRFASLLHPKPSVPEEKPPELIPTQKTIIPPAYDRPLGSYADVQMKVGAIVLNVDEFVQRRYRLASNFGMMIYKIQKTGPFDKAGFQSRDIIVAIGNKRVDSKEAFTYALNQAYSEDRTAIPITVIRNDKPLQLTLRLN